MDGVAVGGGVLVSVLVGSKDRLAVLRESDVLLVGDVDDDSVGVYVVDIEAVNVRLPVASAVGVFQEGDKRAVLVAPVLLGDTVALVERVGESVLDGSPVDVGDALGDAFDAVEDGVVDSVTVMRCVRDGVMRSLLVLPSDGDNDLERVASAVGDGVMRAVCVGGGVIVRVVETVAV